MEVDDDEKEEEVVVVVVVVSAVAVVVVIVMERAQTGMKNQELQTITRALDSDKNEQVFEAISLMEKPAPYPRLSLEFLQTDCLTAAKK